MQSLEKLDEAMKLANEAFGKSRDAETKRQNNDIAGANETVGEAMRALKLRCDFSASTYNAFNHLPCSIAQDQFQSLTERTSSYLIGTMTRLRAIEY